MTAPSDWRPTAPAARLRQRARLLQRLRRFMEEREIMEVDTPALAEYGNPDPAIDPVTVCNGAGAGPLYLHTSPEFPMKRLLAAGCGPIYQVCKVFRRGERGRLHAPEFSMLEWYRPGFDHHALMDELDELLASLGLAAAERLPYGTLFTQHTGLDPHTAADGELAGRAAALGLEVREPDRALLLDFLFSRCVVPHLAERGPTLVYDYPACQAALARLHREAGTPVAERFELFIQGIEIANGYHELGDAREQASRFEADNRRRRARGLPRIAPDPALLAALEAGLPDCAGVAVGLDRLLLVISGADSLAETLSFASAGG